jgi:hypothetical protein
MPLSAWIMLVVVSLVVYGGFAWCLAIAIRKGREHDAAGEDDDL